MININIYWTLCETVFKWRKSWYIPEPKPRTETIYQEVKRKWNTPGALIPYQGGWSPFSILLEKIKQQKKDDLQYIDDNVKKGLYYGSNWEKETEQADLQAEEAFKKSQTKNGGDAYETRLQSLYGTVQRTEPHAYWKGNQIYRTPYRVDSDDNKS